MSNQRRIKILKGTLRNSVLFERRVNAFLKKLNVDPYRSLAVDPLKISSEGGILSVIVVYEQRTKRQGAFNK